MKYCKKERTRKLGIMGPFAAAKGGLAAARSRAKKATPRVHCSEALLHRGDDTVHHDQISYFCSESRVFVHR